MIRSLKKFLFGSQSSGADSLDNQIGEIEQTETVGRFIYQNGDCSRSTNKPKQKVFLPAKHPTLGRWETSVCRIDKASATRVWEIANTIREPLPAVARADIAIQAISAAQLLTEAVPEEGYAEHAVIVGWPDEKEKQKAIAANLVFHATLKYPST